MSQGIMHGDLVCKLNEELLGVREELRQSKAYRAAFVKSEDECDRLRTDLQRHKAALEKAREALKPLRQLTEKDDLKKCLEEKDRQRQEAITAINEVIDNYESPAMRQNFFDAIKSLEACSNSQTARLDARAYAKKFRRRLKK